MLELIVITALALYGTKVTWQEGMIFERPKKWLDESVVPESKEPFNLIWNFWSKPLYRCPACMVSVWGSLIYFISGSSTWNIQSYFTFLLATCGLTWILMYQFPFDD